MQYGSAVGLPHGVDGIWPRAKSSGEAMSKNQADSKLDGLDVEVWLTRPDRSALCARQPARLPVEAWAQTRATIRVNPIRTHQIMDGFGFALTGGSADLIAQLAPATRDALLQELFLPSNGRMGMSCLRISIGASDLSSAAFPTTTCPQEKLTPASTDSTSRPAILR